MCYLMECYVISNIHVLCSKNVRLIFFLSGEVLQLVFKEWFTTNHMVLLKFVANENSKVYVHLQL